MNIAIVEDEGLTALFFKESLEELEHNVVGIFDNSEVFLEFVKIDSRIDLVFMDIQINGKLDGIQLAYELSIKYPDISIVFVTSFKDNDTIKSAKIASPLGYLIKPVVESDLNAILMVVESFKNRHQVEDIHIVHIGNYRYDRANQILSKDNKIIHLSEKEKICFDSLVSNINLYVSHEQLIAKIWNGENNRELSLRELMYRLRKKMPEISITNVSKIGYTLTF